MHFSIPETRQCKDTKGTGTYTVHVIRFKNAQQQVSPIFVSPSFPVLPDPHQRRVPLPRPLSPAPFPPRTAQEGFPPIDDAAVPAKEGLPVGTQPAGREEGGLGEIPADIVTGTEVNVLYSFATLPFSPLDSFQDPRISNCVTFNGFLLAAQQETREEKVEEVTLEVWLMNDSKVTVRGSTILQTDEILEVREKEILTKEECLR